MNTPAHLIFGATAFASPNSRSVTWAAMLGGLIPDLSLYLMVGFHLFYLGTLPEIVFSELYYSEQWQFIFGIDNSFFVWGAIFLAGLAFGHRVIWAFAGAGLLHLLLDFPLHHDDGRAHFWPLTSWVYESPVSYWDNAHYGNIVGPIEIVLVVIAFVFLWRRFKALPERITFGILAACQALPWIIFTIMFRGT